MSTKTIKVADATNLQLDWLVAQCEGHGDRWLSRWREGGDKRFTYCEVVYSYTERPEQMWPIIERMCARGFHLEERPDTLPHALHDYNPMQGEYRFHASGLTLLIAAARCYVASKLGETVEVPEELT